MVGLENGGGLALGANYQRLLAGEFVKAMLGSTETVKAKEADESAKLGLIREDQENQIDDGRGRKETKDGKKRIGKKKRSRQGSRVHILVELVAGVGFEPTMADYESAAVDLA